MKVALVHDWLTGMRGGEKCLEVFCELYPDADLYTLLHVPGSVSSCIESMRIHTSFLQKLPGVHTHYRYALPLMPWAIGTFHLKSYDLVLSSSHCVAKGVRVGKGTRHICYCFTPMRYLWDQFETYFSHSTVQATAMRFLRPFLKNWDTRSNRGVHQFIAISRHIQKKIKENYGRESTVLVPPVDTGYYSPTGDARQDFFLVAGALSPYKRVDLAIDAFNKLGYPLKIIGSGPEEAKLRRQAGPHIKFLGWVSDQQLRSYYARCRALIYPGEEDFGIIPLEAQAMGCPIIALGRGGALETVVPDSRTWKPQTGIPEDKTNMPTGVFFYRQDKDSLCEAVEYFLSIQSQFQSREIRSHVLPFDREQFKYRIRMFIQEFMKKANA